MLAEQHRVYEKKSRFGILGQLSEKLLQDTAIESDALLGSVVVVHEEEVHEEDQLEGKLVRRFVDGELQIHA